MKKGFIGEFREFISCGSVMDMAIGIIIGGAFTAIISSLVNDLIMPLIGIIIGGINFTELKIVLHSAVGETQEVALLYGSFIQAVINFLLIALVLFLFVKGLNKMREKKAAGEQASPEPEPSDELKVLTEIRDLLRRD